MKISGIKLIKKNIIKNDKGNIFKFVSAKDIFFKKFGEVYFNQINKNKTKGWILHKRTKCILSLIYGRVTFHLIDGRKKSKTYNKESKIILDEKSFKILNIPKGIWFSISSKGNKSLIINLIEKPHSDNEVIKKNKVKNYFIKN